MNFADLGLSDAILDAIKLQGYSEPSPIQQKAIPHVIQGKDERVRVRPLDLHCLFCIVYLTRLNLTVLVIRHVV